MPPTVSLFFTLFFATFASSAPPPHGGAPCSDDWDCSLSGVCDQDTKKCTCDPWFTGANCTYLNLARAPNDAQTWGMQIPGSYSWGGHAVEDRTTGKWVGFFAYMENGCNLSTWGTNSAVVMSIADQPEGPYSHNVTTINAPWAHNPYIVENIAHNAPDDERYLLWHVGDGTSPTPPVNCTAAPRDNHIEHTTSDTPPLATLFYVDTASTPSGRWAGEWYILFADPKWVSIPANPAPVIFSNGTVLVYFSTVNCPTGWGLAPRCIGMARSTTGWKGPYEVLGDNPVVDLEGEDPVVFRDQRGHFHMFSNVNTYHVRCASGVPCGGHAWSYDGITWSNQFVGAFGPHIHLQNGSTWQNAYIERPQVVLNADGTPRTFFAGVSRASYFDSTSWAQPFCTKELLEKGACAPSIPLV